MKTPLILRGLDLPQHCDICGQRRNQANHQRCSRQRQQLKRSEKR